MGILSAALRARQARKVEALILAKLREADQLAAQKGQPSVGVDIPTSGDGSDLYAMALNRILVRFPQLTVVRFQDHFTLAPRRAVQQTTSQACFGMLEEQGSLNQPGKPVSEEQPWAT